MRRTSNIAKRCFCSQQRLFRKEVLSLTLKNARTAFFSLIVCAAIGGMFERLKENFNLTYLGLFPLGKSPSGKGMGGKMSRGYIKVIIIKIGIFESFVVEEKHFAENDQYGIFKYKSRYAGQNDLIALTVRMGE